MILIQNDRDLLKECGFSNCDINRLNEKIWNILIDENDEHLDHIKNEEESVIELLLDK